jgi:V8-like Glu-specific endopeptidase
MDILKKNSAGFAALIILIAIFVSCSHEKKTSLHRDVASDDYIPPTFDHIINNELETVQNQNLWPNPNYKSVIGKFKPVVRIIIKFSNPTSWMSCSATSIGNGMILTAAHCLNEGNQKFDYLFAVPDAVFALNNTYGVSFKALQNNPNVFYSKDAQPLMDILPKWDSFSKHLSIATDIAVVELKRDISKYVGKYELLDPSQFLKEIHRSKFGLIGYPEIGQKEGELFSKYYSGQICDITKAAMNALYTNCIPNSGTSGSPLLFEKNGSYYIAGVNSGTYKLGLVEYEFGANYAGLQTIWDDYHKYLESSR